MSGMNLWYGQHVADEGELRLCGDLTGKRVLELGISPTPSSTTANSITLAVGGAKAIALDPSAERIASLREAAEHAEVRVECHIGDLADLGFVTSASIDTVIASHTLDEVDDLPRLIRQVHRVLRSGGPFVVALRHPVADMFIADAAPGRRPADGGNLTEVRHPYGAYGTTFAGLFTMFERSNFRFDTIHELADQRRRQAAYPSVLLLRARKQGD